MAVRHPTHSELKRALADALSLDQRCMAIREAYDLANLETPAWRSANLVGALYREFRAQKRNDNQPISDNEAMRLVDLTLRHNVAERQDIKEKVTDIMGAKFMEIIDASFKNALAKQQAKAKTEEETP